MRLWGIADEPFWPAVNGSWTSPISVCWRLRISVANRSSEPPMTAIAREQRRVPVALDDLGADRVPWRPRAASTSASMSGPRWLYVPTGPEILPVPISSTAAASRVRPRSSSNAQPASLSPSVVGSAWTEWVRPIITVSASARARAMSDATAGRSRPGAARRPPAAGAQGPCRRRRCSSARGGGSDPRARRSRRPGSRRR